MCSQVPVYQTLADSRLLLCRTVGPRTDRKEHMGKSRLSSLFPLRSSSVGWVPPSHPTTLPPFSGSSRPKLRDGDWEVGVAWEGWEVAKNFCPHSQELSCERLDRFVHRHWLPVLRGFAHCRESLKGRTALRLAYCLWALQLLSAGRGIYTEPPAAQSLL